MFRCILFDIDGTILDTKRASLLSAQEAAAQGLGRRYELEELMFTFGLTTLDSAKQMGFSDPTEYRRLVDAAYTKYGVQYNCVFPGIRETLDALEKRAVPMGIVTAKTRWEYDHDFNRFGLHSYFPCSVTADDTTKQKPSPDPVDSFSRTAKIPKQEILYVGDTDCDSICARSAGVAFAFAGWSGNPMPKEVDFHLQHPLQILNYV